MGELAGISQAKAVRAFERAGFALKRQSKHIIMSNGVRIIVVPRHNPIKSYTLIGIVRDADLTVEECKTRLRGRSAGPVDA